MKAKKKASRLLLTLGALCAALAVSLCPAAGITAQAAAHGSADIAMPCSDRIAYRYYTIGNSIYKQLYNYTKNIWVGDPIYVGELP